jgi:tetratricopeptide (TPR) repeat protein
MPAGSRSSGCRICYEHTQCRWYSKKVNQLSRLGVEVSSLAIARRTPSACFVFAGLLVLTPLVLTLLVLTSRPAVAQTPDASRRTLIHGLVVTAQGQPVARATVEVRDLRGMEIASGFTDAAGGFAITLAAKPGEYMLLAEKDLQIGDERIILDQPDREVTIALPAASGSTLATRQQAYTVSVQELRAPARALAHLKLAQEEFSELNFAGAEREVDQALRVNSTCAAAFSMRALLRLASRDFNGAIEAATRSVVLDPAEADAYVALATAYNSSGDFSKAELAAQRALGMRPEFWQSRLELAKAFYGQGRLLQGLRELDELNKDFPDVHLVRANILVQLHRSEEAAKEFGQFLREAPRDPRREQVKRIVSQASATDTLTSSRQ